MGVFEYSWKFSKNLWQKHINILGEIRIASSFGKHHSSPPSVVGKRKREHADFSHLELLS